MATARREEVQEMGVRDPSPFQRLARLAEHRIEVLFGIRGAHGRDQRPGLFARTIGIDAGGRDGRGNRRARRRFGLRFDRPGFDRAGFDRPGFDCCGLDRTRFGRTLPPVARDQDGDDTEDDGGDDERQRSTQGRPAAGAPEHRLQLIDRRDRPAGTTVGNRRGHRPGGHRTERRNAAASRPLLTRRLQGIATRHGAHPLVTGCPRPTRGSKCRRALAAQGPPVPPSLSASL